MIPRLSPTRLSHAALGLIALFSLSTVCSALSPAGEALAGETSAGEAVPGEAVAGEAVADTDLPTSQGEEWSQWRGPRRDGTAQGPPWPADLSGLESAWRVPLGKSYSGPVVTSDKVFVTEALEGGREAARALARSDGRELWKTEWTGAMEVPFFARRNGDWIRSTPAWDGEALYVASMEEVLHKLSGETGEVLWSVDFRARFGTSNPDFGFASSPMIDGDHLYVQAANSIVKLDRQTGETVWRALDEDVTIMSSGAFSSPVLAEIGGLRQLLVLTRKAMFGLEPDTGVVLWEREVPSFRGMHILTPVVWRDRVFTSPYKQRSFLFSVEEAESGWQTSQQWDSKVTGYMSTPVVIDDHLYLHLGNGRLTCLDLETGQDTWTSQSFGDYWSMVAQGEKILALDESGELYLLRANPAELEILDSREVSESSSWAHLAVSDDELFVRELEAIAVYRWQ